MKITENLYKIERTKTTHAMLFKDTLFDFIIENLLKDRRCVDIFYSKQLQPKFNCLVTIPHLCNQRIDYSDINSKVTNYTLDNSINRYLLNDPNK